MADEIEIKPQERTEAVGSSEQGEARKLDDATFEPQALVEQTGDYWQAESIQEDFIRLVGNMAAAADETGFPKKVEGEAAAVLRQTADETGFPKQVAGEAAAVLRPTADETGFPKQVAGEAAAVLRQTADDTSFPKQVAGEAAAALRPTADVAGEAVRIDPIPMPNIAGTGTARLESKEAGGDKVAIDPLPLPNTAGTETAATREETVASRETPAPLDQGEVPRGFKFHDEAGSPVALRGQKIAEGEKSASLRRSADDAGFPKQAEGEAASVLRQTADESGFPKQVAGEAAAALRQTADVTGEAVHIDPVPIPNVARTDSVRLGNKEAGGDKVAIDPVPLPITAGNEAAAKREETIASREAPAPLDQAEDPRGFKFYNEAATPAVLRGQKVAVGDTPAALGQAEDPRGFKFYDEAGSPVALRGQKIAEGDEPASLRRSADDAGFPKQAAGDIPATLRQVQAAEGTVVESTEGTQSANLTPGKEKAGSGLPGMGTSATAPGLGSESITEEGLPESSELEPSDLYVYVGPDGKMVVVDANGNPVDSPPNIQVTGPDGSTLGMPKGYYSGNKNNTFELPYYSGSLSGCSVHIGADGKAVVVDAGGQPLAVQPTIELTDSSGAKLASPKVYYSGNKNNPAELSLFSGSLAGCSVHIGADGKAVVVDASGQPLAAQPTVELVDSSGAKLSSPKVYYSGNKYNPAELSLYSGSLSGCSVHIGADGKAVVVDANGKPLAAQPTVELVDSSGAKLSSPKVYYSGDKNNPAELSLYSGSLSGCSVHIGADGKAVVVDANGNPLAAQPTVELVDSSGAKLSSPKVYYSGDKNNPAELSLYSGSLANCSVYIGSDGKAVVVDANGKPLAAQPTVELYDVSGAKLASPKVYYSGEKNNPAELPVYSGPAPKSSSK